MNESPMTGAVIGLVTSLDDPKKLGRVQVEYPVYKNRKSAWARIAAPMAGKERGFFFRPDKGDEVLVIFEDGDPRQPYVAGALWSKAEPPPKSALPVANDLRLLVSRSGQMLSFNDQSGKETVEIVDKTGDRRVVVESGGKRIRVWAKSGDVEVTADRGNVRVTAKNGSIDLDARTINLKSSGNMKIEARGSLTLKGRKVDIN